MITKASFITLLFLLFFFLGSETVYARPPIWGRIVTTTGVVIPLDQDSSKPVIRWCFKNADGDDLCRNLPHQAGDADDTAVEEWRYDNIGSYFYFAPFWNNGFGCGERGHTLVGISDANFPGEFLPTNFDYVYDLVGNTFVPQRVDIVYKINDTTPPVCTDPTFAPSDKINGDNITGTSTATDANGIAKTGVYVYKVSPNEGVREILNNNNVNTSSPFSAVWDLKDDSGNKVGDGRYEMHFNWYDPSNNLKQCKAPFVIDKTAPACTDPTFAPHPTDPNKVIITSSATDSGVGLNRFGLYIAGQGPIKPNNVTFTPVASKTLSYDWDITGLANGTYTAQANWWDATDNGDPDSYVGSHPGNFAQCTATYTINKVANKIPTCTSPVITPAGIITTSFSATGTGNDDKGIKRTGVYIYKKSPNTHVREVVSNLTANTNNSLKVDWDLKDDKGNVVPDGNYEIHYNWYDVEGAMAQCKTDFTKTTTPPQDAIYSCSTGVTPSSFEFIPSQSKPLSIAITSNTASSINIRWSDSCGLGTFDLLNVSALNKTYALISGTNSLKVDWKAKPGNPVVAAGCKVQANVISALPLPARGILPVCTPASVTAVANQVTWSGKAIWGDLDCPANASSSLWNTNPGLENVNVNIGGISSLTNSSGNYSITKEFFGATITENVYASKSGDYDFLCYKNGNTVKVQAGVNWNKETFVPGNYNITPYFKFAPPAFITANNGDVYSGYKIILNKPSVTNPTYFQTSGSNTLGGLVLSKGDISSAWSDKTTENYSEQGLTNYGLDYQSLLLRIVTEIDNGRYDISGQDIKYISAADLSADNGIFEVTFDQLKTSDYKDKVLIVNGSVVITDSDNFGSDKIQTYIMATGDISFVSSVAKPVNTLKMLGGVFSSGVIKFDREKSALSDGYKDPTIKFDLDASLYVRDNLEALKVANIKWRELL
jgi:flagellar hook assembly protein FlgD